MNTYTITFYSKEHGKLTDTIKAKTAIRATNQLRKKYGSLHTLTIHLTGGY